MAACTAEGKNNFSWFPNVHTALPLNTFLLTRLAEQLRAVCPLSQDTRVKTPAYLQVLELPVGQIFLSLSNDFEGC